MYAIRSVLLCAMLLAACGGNDDNRPTANRENRDYGDDLGFGSGAASPVTIGTIVKPAGGTYFDLIAPPLSAGMTAVPLKAKLSGVNGTYTITSVHLTNGSWSGTSVTAGTYSLEYLDEAGLPTGIKDNVTVLTGDANFKVVGGVWVDPSSAVAAGADAVEGLRYDIDVDGIRLKLAEADLNVVVDLPKGTTTWTPVGSSDARGIPFALDVDERIQPYVWGSIQTKFDSRFQVSLSDAKKNILFFPLRDGAEYLLPAEPQASGCRVYYLTVDTKSVYSRTLCTDTSAHQLFNLQ